MKELAEKNGKLKAHAPKQKLSMTWDPGDSNQGSVEKLIQRSEQENRGTDNPEDVTPDTKGTKQHTAKTK